MPMHDWTRVGAWVFHDFHTCFLVAVKRGLNARLPAGYYAMTEQVTRTMGPDVLTLQELSPPGPGGPGGGVPLTATATPPRVQVAERAAPRPPAFRQKRLAIRHSSNDRLVAILELVSPGNKAARSAVRTFVRKIVRAIDLGIHAVVIDPFPPSRRDANGIHGAVWPELGGNDFVQPAGQPLTLASYEAATAAGEGPRCFVQPIAVGDALPEMPVFVERDRYVPIPFEALYQDAWADVLPQHRQAVGG